MSQTTRIPWCDATWNPVTGCQRVSPGCDHCYAMRMALRFPKTLGHVADGSGWNGKIEMHWPRLYQPKEWKKPRRIFVCSMGDLFYVADFSLITSILNVMKETPRHTYYILSKRPTLAWAALDRAKRGCFLSAGIGWPFPNVLVGFTAENQDMADYRLPVLRDQIEAAGKFVSCEPLLGPVDLRKHLDVVRWVIAGGENGPGARPMDLDWARSLRDQCAEAKVPFFYKGGGAGKDDVLDGRRHQEIPA